VAAATTMQRTADMLADMRVDASQAEHYLLSCSPSMTSAWYILLHACVLKMLSCVLSAVLASVAAVKLNDYMRNPDWKSFQSTPETYAPA
jgi:hypothetical protein